MCEEPEVGDRRPGTEPEAVFRRPRVERVEHAVHSLVAPLMPEASVWKQRSTVVVLAVSAVLFVLGSALAYLVN